MSRELPVETETIKTQLHKRSSEEHYTYTNVPWKIYLRKEVRESLDHRTHRKLQIHLSPFTIH